MMKAPTVFFLLILISGFVVCSSQQAAVPAMAVVTSSVENMFSRATASADVVSQALLGDSVKVLKTERNSDGEDWVRIETPDTYQGWVLASSLRFLKPGDKLYASAGKVFVVSALLANIYGESDTTKHKPVKVAPISAVLEVVEDKDERWLEINLPGDSRAWIQHGDGDVQEAPWSWPRISVESTVALAKRFLGLPYLWGGTSPLGLDCSGFVQLVYKMGGIPILRDAGIQMEKSGLIEVPKGTEQAGDLVFFGSAVDKIGHVGMMINAEEFINATTHAKPIVQIERLRSDYRLKTYQGARRPKK
jgi:gamma-D-glutamyl-L-lysine dipeptidyl-peptidase